MNPEVKKKWIEALRSGKYRQGKGVLCRPGKEGNTFCSLGVLADVLKPPEESWEEVVLNREGDVYSLFDEAFLLPDEICDLAGLEDRNPWAGEFLLTELNDSGATFEEIADLIEEHL